MRSSRKKARKKIFSYIITAVFVLISVIIVFSLVTGESGSEPSLNKYSENKSAEEIIKDYADKNNLSTDDYPDSLVKLLDRNRETEDFVLSYPKEHDKKHKINLRKYKNSDSVPLFMQWDKQWGYIQYGKDIAGLTGCGPLCLSMCAYYLTNDNDMSPDKIIEFAKENGYCLDSGGSSWTLISEGGEKLGLDVTEIPLNENRIIKNLKAGNPIICVMGPGAFTNTGHFIVLTGYKDGSFTVNDPNSYKNSEKEWKYEEFSDQIKNLWVLRE